MGSRNEHNRNSSPVDDSIQAYPSYLNVNFISYEINEEKKKSVIMMMMIIITIIQTF